MKSCFNTRQYTDERNHFIVVEDEVIKNYKILKEIGKGAYGKVCLAINNSKYNENVVLKIIKNKISYRQCAVKEIEILKKLNYSYRDESREFTSIFYNNFDFKGHIFIELKKYGENLYKGTLETQLELNQILNVTIDLIKGLEFLKKNDIIHADLKPENILFLENSREHVVICDFGLSFKLKDVNLKYEVQSMWYRSPEVLFSINYDYCIDLWSLGCIIFELIYDNALFRGSTQEQLFKYFLAFMGTPNNEFQNKNEYTRSFFDLNYNPILKIDNNLKIRSDCKRNYLLNYESKSKSLMILILKIIHWDISDRIIIEDCVNMINDLQNEIKLNSNNVTVTVAKQKTL
jgi:serine/threonine protein kinase